MNDLQGGLLALEHYYEVGGLSGRWVYGARYGAVQRPLARSVGLWVLSGLHKMGASDPLLERIKRAVWRASRLGRAEHLQIIDYGQLEDHSPFIVTERMDGLSNLKEHLADHGPLTPQKTLDVVRGLVAALNDAYQNAIFHGSLHSGCVWLRDDEVKLWGYGMGLSRTDLFALNQAMFTADLTRHLPPEAFEGPSFDLNEQGESPSALRDALAVDVYGLGCITYECLTGFHPYFRDDRGEIDGILSMMREAPPSLSEQFGFSAELSEVVLRAISRDPAARFASPSAFLQALHDALPNPLLAGPAQAPHEPPKASLVDWVLALLDLAPQRMRLWMNRPSTRRALLGALMVTNIVTLLALLHVTQISTKDEAPKQTFAPPAAPGEGVDLMVLPVPDQPDARLHLVSHQGETVLLGPLPYLLRDQKPGTRLTFLVTSSAGDATQIPVVVQEVNEQRWMSVDPSAWRVPGGDHPRAAALSPAPL